MPRRRTARAATRRPLPTLPDSEETSMDEEQRSRKVQTLIDDFDAEVNSRIRELEGSLKVMLNQIDLAYSLEMMQIPAAVKSMKFKDFVKNGEVYNNPVVNSQLTQQALSVVGERPLSAINEDGSQAACTVKRKAQRRKAQEGETITQQTCRQSTRVRKMAFQTPANQGLATLSMTTPLITPKFDPRLYHTPAVSARGYKPDEVVMSMAGSPLANPGPGRLVSLDDRTMWFPDISGLSGNDAEKAYQVIDEMKSQLEAVLKLNQASG